ncbi:DegT/DnrJ/EryC1/StrS family aminotransferase [Gemmatimonadota bacterium]
MIPFVDLKAQYRQIRQELDEAIQSIIDRTAFIGGGAVSEFERSFSEYLGVSFTVGVGNGTDALFLALKAAGLGEGDEVLVPAMTFIATSEAVSMCGATPVFVDVDTDGLLIDLEQANRKVSERTRAIIPVHLYGQPADMDSVVEFAGTHDLAIVEDCAQSHGATFNKSVTGTIGHVGCFSFYPGKNLGAFGDGGAVVTNDEELAERVRMLANHGRLDKYNHLIEGVNSRLDALQAAILSVKLKYLEGWTEARIRNAAHYSESLEDIPEIRVPVTLPDRRHVFHLYVIRAERRDELMEYLKSHEVGVGIHYPIPIPLLEAYAYQGHNPEDFPVAAGASQEILSLPMFPELSQSDTDRVSELIRKYYHA